MTTTLRIDDDLKRDCELIFDDLGLSMSGAVTIFLKQVVKQRGIPFAVTCRQTEFADNVGMRRGGFRERGLTAMRYAAEMRASADREWSMDEIDAEIAAARRERKSGVSQ